MDFYKGKSNNEDMTSSLKDKLEGENEIKERLEGNSNKKGFFKKY